MVGDKVQRSTRVGAARATMPADDGRLMDDVAYDDDIDVAVVSSHHQVGRRLN